LDIIDYKWHIKKVKRSNMTRQTRNTHARQVTYEPYAGANTAAVILQNMPRTDRPRERLLAYGAESLSNSELLAILLRSGSQGHSAVLLAAEILQTSGSLSRLARLSITELTQFKGMGQVKAIQLKAAMELGRRMSVDKLGEKPILNEPADVYQFLADSLRGATQEHFIGLFLNNKHELIRKQTIGIGLLNEVLVEPRELFMPAIRENSFAIVCAHNHPSGDPTPSGKDITLTRRLCQSGHILGIEILDHIVIGHDRFISLKREGLM
jgi:DNA repair protein RadC